MIDRETYGMLGFQELGGGYDNEAYVLAGMLLCAADNLRYGQGDYPENLQEAMRQFELYALGKQREVMRNRASAEEAFWSGESCFLANFADSGKAYGILKSFELHRLSPRFHSTSFNDMIVEARAKHEAARRAEEARRPKGFWESLFG